MMRNGTMNVGRKVVMTVRNASSMNFQQIAQAKPMVSAEVLNAMGVGTFIGTTMYFAYPKKDMGNSTLLNGHRDGTGYLYIDGATHNHVMAKDYRHGEKAPHTMPVQKKGSMEGHTMGGYVLPPDIEASFK